jgi:hypothetical protein
MSGTTIKRVKTIKPKEASLDNPIYKVKLSTNGAVSTIFVFNGKKTTENENELFEKAFTAAEKTQIDEDGITVQFCEQQIHFDDSISAIKLKILKELRQEISVDELYLYCQKMEVLSAVSVYQSLTQNNRLQLTKVLLDQFISNIVSDETGKLFERPVDKETYSFDDIFEMGFNDKKYIVNKVLGQKFFIVENEYPFVCDPYSVTEYDQFFEKSARKSLTTLNSHLLLSSGSIIDNSIYLCLAKDVISYLDKRNVSEETTIKVYYPLLYNKNINNLDDLDTNAVKLNEASKKLLGEKTLASFKTIDMFYDMYNLRTTELNYLNRGIKFIKAVIRPDFDVKIPLETIFKIVHATKENPLIKYNPSSRQENVYRLFTDSIATDGRRIPALKKNVVFKLMKTIARTKSVAVYVDSVKTTDTHALVCEFDEDGLITISSEFTTFVGVNEIDNIFRESINPIITEIKNLLEQSGYKLAKFNSLNDDNVEIKQLTYETQIKIQKPLDIDAYRGCVSSVFVNETDAFKGNTINLRFKRVSNYSKFTSQEAFILEKAEQGLRGDQIIDALLENFPDDLDRPQAIEMVKRVANELEIERGVRRSDIKIKNNPGFKTVISTEKETGVITITTENINNINYLQTLPIYLDTLVRLTQDKKSTRYPLKEITALCSSGEKEEMVIPDIISPSEESVSSYEAPSLDQEDEDVMYTKFAPTDVNKPKGALGLFFDEDDEGEEGEMSNDAEYDGKGGQDSESSVSSEKTSDTPAATLPNEEFPSNSELMPAIESSTSVTTEPKNEDIAEQANESEAKESEAKESEAKEYEAKESEAKESEAKESEAKESEAKESEAKESEAKESEEAKEEANEEANSDAEDDEEEDEVRNIDGMKLNKPYHFQALIEKKDPVLILKEDTELFNSYPRTCSSNMRRQPVILTDSQLAKINKDHPDFLRKEDVIKYGSDEKHQFNYICPRYWCLKNNSFVDPKDLTPVTEDGKTELVHPTCGKVLPKGEKTVKPGYYVYEFYQPKPGKKDYKKYPGLIANSHPNKGICLPCCFDKYNTEGRRGENQKCLGQEPAKKEGKPKEVVEDEYVKGPEKFPLDSGRWGYLPAEIQTMLHEVNADCQISKTNSNIKENHPCLLRHGVEVNKNQSFVACVSDVLFFGKRVVDDENKLTKNMTRVLSIKEMRQRIIKAISIDSFVKYQNGNLVVDFFDPAKPAEVEKYRSSKLYSKLYSSDTPNTPESAEYFFKVASAFENFVRFLSDDDVVIDHTYLWDIISLPNKYLFPTGVNLVIFHLPKDDITNNVSILCPTNHYSSEFYQARKPTIILMSEDGYYEPIYSYTTNSKGISVVKEFKEYDPHLSKTMRAVFKEIIKPFFTLICKPLDSLPNLYRAKRSLIVYDLIQKLDKYEYKTKKLVLNFNNKIIGVVAEEPGGSDRTGFVPCYPSTLDEDIKKNLDYVFMTDPTLWNTYTNTVQFLNKLYKRSGKRRPSPDIPCEPEFNVVEDEHVVGILINTGQFIQLSQPVRLDEIDPDLRLTKNINNDNYIVNMKSNPMVSTEVEFTTQRDVDKERVDYVRKIRLETNFYNVFRNTIRILINDYDNAKVRVEIEDETKREYVIYSEKLKTITALLHDLVGDHIQFTGDDDFYKSINEVSTCVVKDEASCSATPNLCVTEKNSCNLILPNKNIITGHENEDIYYGRMADELIRYNRIRSFMFQPKSYLSFTNVNYNLNDTEIILIQPILLQYFDTLNPAPINKYTRTVSYDEAQPIISQVYENTIPSLDHAIGRKNERVCNKITNEHITSSVWKGCFPANYTEVEYSKFNYCTFTFIIDLIEKRTGTVLTINQVKNELFDEYRTYLGEFQDKIVDILILEGKKTLGDQVHAATLSFQSFLYTDNYFLTALDLWLLVSKYKIPTIFISQKWILQTKYEKHEFVGYGDVGDKFTFIVIPAFRPEIVPGYKLIQTNTGDTEISLDKLTENCVERIRTAVNTKVSVAAYLKSFKRPPTTVYKKKIPFAIEAEQPENKPARKTKVVVEEEEVLDISPEEMFELPKKKRTRRKIAVARKGRSRTAKAKREFVIASSSDKSDN